MPRVRSDIVSPTRQRGWRIPLLPEAHVAVYPRGRVGLTKLVRWLRLGRLLRGTVRGGTRCQVARGNRGRVEILGRYEVTQEKAEKCRSAFRYYNLANFKKGDQNGFRVALYRE